MPWWSIATLPTGDGSAPPAGGPWRLPTGGGKRSFTVGRKEEAADVVIASDKSLSRTHAEFVLADGDVLQIKDLASKYGVHIGGERIGQEPLALADGAQLKLGSTHFVVRRMPLVVCLSGLAGAEKAKMRQACEAIGATLVKEWEDNVRAPPPAPPPLRQSRTKCTPVPTCPTSRTLESRSVPRTRTLSLPSFHARRIRVSHRIVAAEPVRGARVVRVRR